MKKYFLATMMLVMAMFGHVLQAQDDGDDASPTDPPNIDQLVQVPQSPEAAAFEQYGNSSVSLYSGKPDISIPIHTLSGRKLSMPVSMTYNAGGVRVGEIATWVGLGWHLNVGGVVTRQSNGKPDDYSSAFGNYIPFYMDSYKDHYGMFKDLDIRENTDYAPGIIEKYLHFVQAHKEGRFETQPDTYSFNANDLSGTMYIDYETATFQEIGTSETEQVATARCLERPDLKIRVTLKLKTSCKIPIKWEITNTDGTRYIFELAEETTLNTYGNGGGSGDSKIYTSAWHLTEVITANDEDHFVFTYDTPTSWLQPQQMTGLGEVFRMAGSAGCGQNTSFSSTYEYKIKQPLLQSISVNDNIQLELETYNTERLDLRGKKALHKIYCYAKAPELNHQLNHAIRTIEFQHSYFGNEATAIHEAQLRLKLEKVHLYGEYNTPAQNYAFDYFEGSGVNSFPSRYSYAQDYWGYYNGKNTNSSLLPSITENERCFSPNSRDADLAYCTIGTMKKVTYPTGGYTQFEYKLHRDGKPETCSWVDYQEYLQTDVTGGEDTNDPYNYLGCDDGSPIAPIGEKDSFLIDEAGEYEVLVTITGNSTNGGNFMQFAALYPSGPTPTGQECFQIGNTTHCLEPTDPSRDFCSLTNDGNLTFYHTGNDSRERIIPKMMHLDSGYYRSLVLNNNPDVNIRLQVRRLETFTETREGMDVGGLRLHKMTDHAGEHAVPMVNYFYYDDLSKKTTSEITEHFLNTNKESSGVLHQPINFTSTYTAESFKVDRQGCNDINSGGCGTANLIECSQRQIHASNLYAARPQHIAYSSITQVSFDGEKQMGYTVSDFHNELDLQSLIPFQLRHPLNGQSKGNRVYDREGDLLQKEEVFMTAEFLKSEVGYFYTVDQVVEKYMVIKERASNGKEFYELIDRRYNGYMVQGCYIIEENTSVNTECIVYPINNGQAGGSLCTHEPNPQGHILVTCIDGPLPLNKKVKYTIPAYWMKQDSVVTTQYGEGRAITSTTKSFYDNPDHFQVTRTETEDSNHELRTVYYAYPHDEMANGDPQHQAAMDILRLQNRLTPIRVHMTDSEGELSALWNQYDQFGSYYLPKTIWSSKNGLPLEKQINYLKYDEKNNPLELSRDQGLHLAYLWDNSNTFLLAKTVNASPNAIFHTSFEEVGVATFGARTGDKAISAYQKTLTNLPAGTYLISYWKLVNNEWQYHEEEQEVVAGGSININLSVGTATMFDELRVHPKMGQMQTFSYDEKGRVSTLCNENGTVLHYEYDKHGRLIVARDEDGNIIKAYQYEYGN